MYQATVESTHHKDTGHKPEELVISQFAQTIVFYQLIFISDEKDKVIPLEWTNTVHKVIPNPELKLLKNTGHFRMLWSEQLEALIKEQAWSKELYLILINSNACQHFLNQN